MNRKIVLLNLALLGLVLVHVLAALKHHFHDRDDVMARMVPGLAQKPAQNPKGSK